MLEWLKEILGDGGDATGYQIPFNLHYKGAPVKGHFKVDTICTQPFDIFWLRCRALLLR